MANLNRIAPALSAIVLAASLTGCAAPLGRTAHAPKSSADFALATRAQASLASGDLQTAVQLSERAVELSADDAGVRALLGNAYFASGRFASAEAAFKDSLAIQPAQPKLFLKLALVKIAQGKAGEAAAYLDGVRNALNASDYGLALALGGRTAEAIKVLEQAARAPGADAQVRQNLALAHGLAGNWDVARIIASQDLSPALVDGRVQQWMEFAKPGRSADQVAALTGVVPASIDPGQPLRLALNREVGQQMADAAPAAAPVAIAELDPVAVPAEAEPVSAALPPVPEYIAPPAPPAPSPAMFETIAPKSLARPAAASKLARIRAGAAEAGKPSSPIARASSGNSGLVVQLGAYSSREGVARAWEQASKSYPALRSYTPTSARFDGPDGTVYRLAIKGFDGQSDAAGLCASLKRKGRECFVRQAAGDAPVRFASR